MSNPSWEQKRSATHRPYRSATSSSPMRRRIRPEASPSPNVGPQKFLRVFSGRIACIIRWWPGSWTTDPNGKQAFLLLFWFGRLLVIAKFGKRTYYEEFNKVRSSYKMMMKLLISFLTCLDCSLNANPLSIFLLLHPQVMMWWLCARLDGPFCAIHVSAFHTLWAHDTVYGSITLEKMQI